MGKFSLIKDVLVPTWHRHKYEIEAETQEEAIQQILNDEAEPYDFEYIEEYQPPQTIEIIDFDDNVLYKE